MATSKKDTSPSKDVDPELAKRVDSIMGVDQSDTKASIAPKTAPELPSAASKKREAAVAKPAAEAVPDSEKITTEAAAEEPESVESKVSIENSSIDKAVDDIVAREGDELLEVEDRARAAVTPTAKPSWRAKIRQRLTNKWFLAAVLVSLLIIFGLPASRYKLLGLVVKKSVTISVVDSVTSKPVSEAQVTIAGQNIKTDAKGQASFQISVGSKQLKATKQYYKNDSQALFVGFRAIAVSPIKLVATGRQVPVIVLNKITHQPIAGATVSVLDTSARTDAKGQATIVLPTTSISDAAKLAAAGFNAAQSTIQVTSSLVPANTVYLTPAGQVYFLSNLSGTVDVVKTNLDGSGRQVVFAGSGQEDPNNSVLLASQDWHYVALKSQRSSNQPSLYVIDTKTDKVTEFDAGGANFTPIGWYGHDFLYDAVSTKSDASQPGHEVVKSYNAESSQLNQLDQNQAEGSSASYANQQFYNFYILNGVLSYVTQWYSYDTTSAGVSLAGKTDTIRAIQLASGVKKDYQTFDATTVNYIQSAPAGAKLVDYQVYDGQNSSTTYYQFDTAAVTSQTSLPPAIFNGYFATYLISPAGNQAFWAQAADGKNSLFLGDKYGQAAKQIASLSDYSPFGWYGTYLLLSKGDDELYIMPAGSLLPNQQPLKITSYMQTAVHIPGSSYSYGGL